MTTELDEEAYKYSLEHRASVYGRVDIIDAFIAGAKWQAEQLLKSSPLPEDTLIFRKGVEEGRRLEREDTLANLSYNELMGLYKNIRDEIRRREETK